LPILLLSDSFDEPSDAIATTTNLLCVMVAILPVAQLATVNNNQMTITVELCIGGDDDDEIRGDRFYLTSNLRHRTSGKYLIKNFDGSTIY
jgi:hypothetical protein